MPSQRVSDDSDTVRVHLRQRFEEVYRPGLDEPIRIPRDSEALYLLQQVRDDWNFLSPQLEDLAATLNDGKARHAFAFDPRRCMAPLPRAYQWADGSAYINHVELVRAARNAKVPESFHSDPLMYQGASDDMLLKELG